MQKILFYGLWVVMGILGIRTLVGSDGWLEYQALLERHRGLLHEKEALERENRNLSRRVLRLQEDWVYIDAVAREQLSMVPANALVYRFGETVPDP